MKNSTNTKIHQKFSGFYHVFSRSIAKYQIFSRPSDCYRMLQTMVFYLSPQKHKLSHQLIYGTDPLKSYDLRAPANIEILAYCLMPNHFHILLRETLPLAAKKYVHKVLTSYSHYFNLLHNRRGPLWESRVTTKPAEDEAYVNFLTGYINLNPARANLVKKPTDWTYSSIHEYLGSKTNLPKICNFKKHLLVDLKDYEEFLKYCAGKKTDIDFERILYKYGSFPADPEWDSGSA